MPERLLPEARTWALVDPLAVSVAGEVALRDPPAGDPGIGWVLRELGKREPATVVAARGR